MTLNYVYYNVDYGIQYLHFASVPEGPGRRIWRTDFEAAYRF